MISFCTDSSKCEVSELSSDRLGVDGRADSDRERRAAEGGDEGRRVAVFEGGQETSRVMNFSTRCFRGVTRTRTGVRKQVVADICSARGPGCPRYPLAPLHASIPPPSFPAVSFCVSPSLPQRCRPEPDRWIVSRCRRETENESETIFFLFFLWSHI